MPFANPGQQGGGEAANTTGPDAWFRSLPLVTQYFFGGTIAMTLAVNFDVIPGMKVAFYWSQVRYNYELWRLLTCFFYAGGFSMNLMISLFMLVQFSQQYERGGPYNTGAGGGTADYLFMMMFGAVVTLLTFPIMSMVLPSAPLFNQNMISYVLYVWSRRNPTANANIWGIPVPGIYLPFAHLGLTVVMGQPYADQLHGLAVGHIYYFLVDVVPQVQGKDILHTPQFLIDRLGVGEYQPQVQAAPRPAAAGARVGGGARVAGLHQPTTGGSAPSGNSTGGGGHNWGSGGHSLGRS